MVSTYYKHHREKLRGKLTKMVRVECLCVAWQTTGPRRGVGKGELDGPRGKVFIDWVGI